VRETDGLPTPRTALRTGYVRVLVFCNSCRHQLLEVCNRVTTSGDRVVAVTVNERHARAVVEILAMQAPAIMTEAPLNVA
jgi:hypothetical protein